MNLPKTKRESSPDSKVSSGDDHPFGLNTHHPYATRLWESLVSWLPRRGSVWTLGVAAGLALLTVWPLLLILSRAWRGGWADLVAGVSSTMWMSALDSAWLGLLVTGFSFCLALPLAWAVERTVLGRMPWLEAVLLLPFITPPYIATMGWMLFMEPGGLLQTAVPAASVLEEPFFSVWGLAWVMTLHLFPIMFLALRQPLRAVSGKLQDAARVQGAGARTRFRWIEWPLLVRAAVGAGVLVFILAIGEFGTPLVFSGMMRFSVLTTAIYQDATQWPIDFTAAARLALLLLTLSLLALNGFWFLRRRRFAFDPASSGGAVVRNPAVEQNRVHRHAPGGGSPQRQGIGTLGTWVACMYTWCLFMTALAVPFGTMFLEALLRVEGDGLIWSNLTLAHFEHIVTPGTDAFRSLLTSFGLALVAAVVATALGALVVATSLAVRKPLAAGIEGLAVLPNTIPNVLMVIGLIFFWNAPWLPWTLYNTPGMLVLAFVLLFLPFPFIYIRQAMTDLPPSLWWAGRILGAGHLRIGMRLVLPLLAPALAFGAVMVFAVSFRDLAVPMLLSPPNLLTAPGYIFGQFDQGTIPDGMAMATISTGLSVALSLGVLHFSRRVWPG